jgi:antitoxin VapB
MATAKVFSNGRSQAVRIPKEYRFDVDEVFINKIGNVLVLAPREDLAAEFEKGAAMLTEDFLAEGVPESIPSFREAL